MDPNATIQRAIDALNAHDWSEYLSSMSDYTSWVKGGGFKADPSLLEALSDTVERELPENLAYGEAPSVWS